MKRAVLIIILEMWCAASLFSQNNDRYVSAEHGVVPPLSVPMSFSGTYGELRRNHFHGGLDFRTGGRTGEPVHAIKKGYVSRASVSPTGYGLGIYVTHEDGFISVYGHLSEFMKPVAERVLEEQYSAESYKVDLRFSPEEFPVEQGDVIGKSGNSGSSAGPHLHMEIRSDEDTPIDYLEHGYYNFPDNTPPAFQRVAFYSYEDSTGAIECNLVRMVNFPTGGPVGVIKLPRRSYVAVDAVDKIEGNPSKLAVETYRVQLDDSQLFKYTVGDVPFSLGRYIYSLTQSGVPGADMIKSRVEPGCGLLDRIESENDGIIELDDDEIHYLRVEVSDCFGNMNSATFKLQGCDTLNFVRALPDSAARRVVMSWNEPNVIACDGVAFSVPQGSLYSNVACGVLKVNEADTAAGILSDVWSFVAEGVALHQPAQISFAVPDADSSSVGTLLIARVAKDGKLVAEGGRYEDGEVTARVGFGTYCVAADTVAPKITPALGKENRTSDTGRFSVKLTDDFSGVKDFRVEVDGVWALSMFKSGRITVWLDKERHGRGSHKVKVTATDACNNKSEKNFNIIW